MAGIDVLGESNVSLHEMYDDLLSLRRSKLYHYLRARSDEYRQNQVRSLVEMALRSTDNNLCIMANAIVAEARLWAEMEDIQARVENAESERSEIPSAMMFKPYDTPVFSG